MRVMDLQQEQLARSLGEGHRVIHGVAGSGKTMILGYRAEQLAKAARQHKPVLVLCYNEPLAVKLDAVMPPRVWATRFRCATSTSGAASSSSPSASPFRPGHGHVRRRWSTT